MGSNPKTTRLNQPRPGPTLDNERQLEQTKADQSSLNATRGDEDQI
jgi:hypothetical protein